MKISVIVPVYHTEQYLNTCVASILGQTYKDYELILVDDASGDACVTMCDDWASRDPRIRVIHKPLNEGLAAARNTGVLAAQGDYVCYVDSDDEISPYYLEFLLLNAERFHADVTYCHFTKHRNVLLEECIGDGRALPRVRPDTSEQEIPNAIRHSRNELWGLLAGVGAGAQGTTFIVAWNKLIRTEIARQITFPKGRWHEDEYYVNQLLQMGRTFVEVPQALYYYRQRDESIMAARNRIDPRHMDIIGAFEERVRLCKNNDALYRKMITAYRWTIYIQYHTFGTGLCAARLRWRILTSLVRYPAPGLKGTRNALLFVTNPKAFYHKNWHESAADN